MDPQSLKRLRAALELTQAELAHELGVAKSTVARWETGVLPIERLTALAVQHLQCALPHKARAQKK